MDIVATLKRLSEASGVSGYEDEVREIVKELLRPCADEVRADTLGNVIAVKEGAGPEPRPAIMIATHMDEIGLIVASIEKGFVHFERVGGFDDRILLGQEVVIHGRSELSGIIGARPPHDECAYGRTAVCDSDSEYPRSGEPAECACGPDSDFLSYL